ncbi:protein Wnt-16 [Perca flavescens]|uniref:protein Wnt-16 n=1 Tax=Perca flavescens TaxID=8167 RepID=UPI00106E02AF|nr:protein Wnt-16 [Perca flavescens]
MESRHMCTLTLLLVSVCPLCCRATWMWLGVGPGSIPGPGSDPGSGSGSVPESRVCADLPLSPRQRDICRKKPFLLPSVRDGARLAIAECQNQFRHERWNCSIGTGTDPARFTQQLAAGTKETAFIYAVMAAGLVHAVTRACSHGNMTECGCDTRPRSGSSPPAEEDGWHWGGCSDHIQYGVWFSRRFIDGAGRNASAAGGGYTPSGANRHNSEAGRQAIVKTMLTHCRCHGVSGSCAVKTCWKSAAPFERVGAYLKQRYERSVQVWDRSKMKPPRRKEPRLPAAAHQLVFFNKSPNYCVADRRRGVLGTTGRRCSRTSTGPDSCVLLCCGRGYNTHLVRHVQRCECKFVWCCYVRCRRCESMNDMHTCK